MDTGFHSWQASRSMLHVFPVCSPLWGTTSLQVAVSWWMRKVLQHLLFSHLLYPHANLSYKRPKPKRCTIFQEECNCQNWFKNQKLTNNKKKTWKLKVVLILKHLFKVFCCCKTKPIRFWHKCNFSTKQMPKGGFSVWDCHLVGSAVGLANNSGKVG